MWVTCCSCCVHLHVKMFFVRRDIYHSLAARNLSQPSGERFPQMVCGEIFFGWLQRAPLGGSHQEPLNHQESLNGKSSQKSLHDCMTPSETFGKFFACSALYAFFLLFSSLGPIRPSGGFSDLQKRKDFESRAPRRHKTVGFGTASGQYVAS